MTRKQLAMISLLGQGLPMKEIAYRLGITVWSAKTTSIRRQKQLGGHLDLNFVSGLHFRMVCKSFTEVLAS